MSIATYPQLKPAKRTYYYTVRYSDNSTEPFEITILPRKGQNRTHADDALREIIADNKPYRGRSVVGFVVDNTSEEG